MKRTTRRRPKPIVSFLLHTLIAILACGVFIGVYFLEPIYYKRFNFTFFVIMITVTSFVISQLLYFAERFMTKHGLTSAILFSGCAIVLPLLMSLILELMIFSTNNSAALYLPMNLFYPQLTYLFMVVYRIVYFFFALAKKPRKTKKEDTEQTASQD